MVYRWAMLGRIIRQTFSRRYFSLRFLGWISGILLLKNIILVLARALQWLDPILFPRYRKARIEAPVFILANPRSGTTFMHRLMCQDPQFTHLKLYQSMFPSVLWYKFFEWLGRIDGWLGRPLYRFVMTPINRLVFGGWDGIHKVGFDQAEEDETTWIYIWSTPGMIVFFPFLKEMEAGIYLDREPRPYLDKVNNYLLGSLQRHMYAEGQGKIYLGKNACAGPRVHRYLEVMPDLRVVHLYRHPYESIGSALSMFCKVWKVHSPQAYGATPEARYAAEMWCSTYRMLTDLRDELPREQYIEFAYTDFVADPKGTVEQIYGHFGLELTNEYAAFLESENQRACSYESEHAYDLGVFGISKDWIYEQLQDVFERYGFER